MKRRLTIAAALLAVALGFGWHNHRQLARLHHARVKLVADAAVKGISLDPQSPSQVTLPSKLPRVDRVAEAKQVSADFIAYAGEMKELEAIERKRGTLEDRWDPFALDEATRQRIIAQIDRVTSLDGGQLKILIGELHAGSDDSEQHRYLIGFALHRLMENHPRELLEILTDSPGLFERVQSKGSWAQSMVGNALCRLGKQDLEAARQWLDEHREVLSAKTTDEVTRRLISTAATQDLRLARDMIEESGIAAPYLLPSLLAQAAPEQRNLALTLLREWSGARSDDAASNGTFEGALKSLAFGEQGLSVPRPPVFEESSAWIDQAGLSPEELQILTDNFQFRIKMEEAGQWIGWIGRSLPDELAERRVKPMFYHWIETDFKAAGTWLQSAAEGPMKDSMVDIYVEKVFPVEKEMAIQVVLNLPKGEKRDGALKKLYQRWPRGNEASIAAAEAFAEKHGIKK